MATWNSRGLRGSVFEDLINRSNEIYLEKGLALIQKIPTPITPIRMDKQSRHITLAYFEQKSTVDYIGCIQGIPVCFDAKECRSDTFALQNLHEHQVRFMTEFEKQGGVAFLLIYYSSKDLPYYLTYQEMFPYGRTGYELYPSSPSGNFCALSGWTAKRFITQGLTIFPCTFIIIR